MTRKVRKDIRELEDAYNAGDKKPLEDVIRAWRGIQKLHPDHKHSFFKIAGYHGEPFRGAGWGNPSWWGGYCNHGNVLFPVWHRAYLLELEKALQSIDGCKDVTLPYWNETDKATEESGLPKIFLQKTFPLDGVNIPNPLYSYKFQAGVYDNLVTIPDHDYTKPPEYQTVRYPWSGLVGTPDDVATTNVHNETLKQLGDDAVNKLLNDNVKNWLGFSVTTSDGKTIYTGNRVKYAKCLEAPNYTVFSNTTSAQQWNEDHFGVKAWREEDAPNPAPEAVVPLESPHNALHLAIGGFEVPGFNANNYPDASGDMGENDTASFDPIFFFHHSFIDKVFWAWQKKWNATKSLHIIDGYPGTNSVDNQGPTPASPETHG
ncbi:common central domain of tyrosinase-domain-containing protein [Trichophaea hybrida]|nr:common central domain of tyrosinase-domain-containing protein [Trichophaea hybrida]